MSALFVFRQGRQTCIQTKTSHVKRNRQRNAIEQGFGVKHKGEPQIPFYVKGTFKKDPDGEWRLVTFKFFDPINKNEEKEIPGL